MQTCSCGSLTVPQTMRSLDLGVEVHFSYQTKRFLSSSSRSSKNIHTWLLTRELAHFMKPMNEFSIPELTKIQAPLPSGHRYISPEICGHRYISPEMGGKGVPPFLLVSHIRVQWYSQKGSLIDQVESSWERDATT